MLILRQRGQNRDFFLYFCQRISFKTMMRLFAAKSTLRIRTTHSNLQEDTLAFWRRTIDDLITIPVSYTHLDVYKRQLLALAITLSVR